jgi:hypothetical protein
MCIYEINNKIFGIFVTDWGQSHALGTIQFVVPFHPMVIVCSPKKLTVGRPQSHHYLCADSPLSTHAKKQSTFDFVLFPR